MENEQDDNLVFQTLDWEEYQHQEDDGGNSDDEEVSMKKYIVRLYGKTKDQQSVYLEVTDFKPYFYIEVKDNWTYTQINRFMEAVKENVWPKVNKEGLLKFERVQKCRFYGFTNYRKFTFLQLHFENIDSMRAYDRALKKYYKILTISKFPIKVKIYESNLLPMLRLMHIKNMNAVGTISIPKSKLSKQTYHKTCNDLNYKTSWKNIQAIEEQYIEKFTICSFDIECTSKDGSFPQAERIEDKIIQIGLTMSRYGEADCYEKYLLSLGETDDIEGATVQWYETEVDLLLGFAKLIRKINPDIMTGYNIFGFDWKYIKGRIDRLTQYLKDQGQNMEANKFKNCVEKMSRINNDISNFEEKNLSSSALGENILTFYKMSGRVQIDLMKVVQKDFKLSSYKLDYVAANFIRDTIFYLELDEKKGIVKMETKGIYGLTTDNFITIGFSDGAVEDKYHDGQKFKVQALDKNTITIKANLDDIEEFMELNEDPKSKFFGKITPKKGFSVFWTQAKDDITPRDIFEMAGDNGTPKGRAIIGRYCIAEGTPVMLENICVPIETLNKNINNNVLSWNNEKNGLSNSKQSKFFNNGNHECVELTFEDGTKLTCTKDHQILTSNNEWITAENLKIGEDRIKKGFTYPTSNIKEDMDKYKDWSFNNLNLKTEENYNKTMAYVRLLGYALTDGYIANNRSVLYVGCIQDVNSILTDIKIICGNDIKINVRKALNTYTFDLPRIISKEYLAIKGVTTGKRINQDATFPEFILDNNCPIPVIREFLGGLFGGDGHTTSYRENSNDFSVIGFSQTRTQDKLDNLNEYMNKLSNLLKKFGINSTIHNKRKKENGNFSISLVIETICIPKFEDLIGFRYCAHKSFRLAIGSSYFKYKMNIYRQSDIVFEKTKEFMKECMDCKSSVKKAHDYLRNNEVIYNEHYSLPCYNSIFRRIKANKSETKMIPMKDEYFTLPKEYLNNLGVYEYFKNINGNQNEKLYSVKKDDDIIPTYNLKIIDRKKVGIKKVYDIEVSETHSYLANGFVVHNCIQDASLCNRLISKLQIITNNVGMANVCNVPLSFLFLRGQGIKIFSLVAKKCRERNHLLPVLKKEKKKDDKDKNNKDKKDNKDTKSKDNKNNNTWNKKVYTDDINEDILQKHINDLNKKGMDIQEDEDEDDTYEGAIVFIPKPGVYYEPIPVLDYSSLYPNSMRLRNLSHECLVDDPAYDNLPGYKYHEITYTMGEDKEVTCRFAEKLDGTKGIIPEILTDLLTARKKYKKLMDNEKDYFKKSVLDGLQLAYKVTANSLYGQTGAGTSDIFMKEIAASTTATGREMLQFAKYFIEDMYSPVVSLALQDKEKFMKKMYELYKYYPTKFDTFHPTKTSKDYPEGIPVKIHVNTLENEDIPAAKFNVPEIGYEINYNFDDDIWKNIVPKLIDITPSDREEFYDIIEKIISGKKKSKHFHKNFENILKEVNINNNDELDTVFDKITDLDEAGQNSFLLNLRIAIDDLGFKNKEEFFDKVYVSIKKILNGYTIDAKIIYGDSVTGDTPLLLRDNNKNIIIKTIGELGNAWTQYYNGAFDQDKLEDKNINYEVWTEKGWTQINRVIKHKTNKKIYGVLTHTGYVQVTEDHSLLDKNGERIKPNECKIGEELLHSFPTNLSNNNNENINSKEHDKLYIYGFFMGDGSCGKYGEKDKTKYSWALNSNDMKLCEELKKKLENIYGVNFKILDTIKSSGVYTVVPNCGNIKSFVEEFNKMYNINKNKIIPQEILTASISKKEIFLEGFYATDGNRKDTEICNCHRFDQKSQASAMCLYYLLNSMGYYVSINNRTDKIDVFRLTYSKNKQRKSSTSIKKISEIKYDEEQWVYDLETENHHFHAGIGEIIVHNTDSVFFCPHIKDNNTGELQKDKKSQKISIRLGIWASVMVGIMMPSPMKLEYEKVLWPFVIQGKKRYVGNLYEKDPNKFKQKSMGIELKRRDNAPVVKTVSAGIINKIVNERNSEGAIEFVKDMLEKIIHDKLKMNKFVITKTLKGNALTKEERVLEAKKSKEQRTYAERTRIVHAVLADRIADRDPGNKPLSNDRIPYAYIETKYEPELQGERVETPDYITENNLKLDYLFYITNQIMKPSLKFLDLISDKADNIFKDYIVREENRKRSTMPLSYYSDKKIEINEIFEEKSDSNSNNSKDKKLKKIKKINKTNKKEKKKKKESEEIILESKEVWFDDDF